MNPYADIDIHLTKEAAVRGWYVSTEWAGAPARFFHIGGVGPWDCFQIFIDPPASGEVEIWAGSVDTNDGQQFKTRFAGPVINFERLLAAAVDQVEVWKRRG